MEKSGYFELNNNLSLANDLEERIYDSEAKSRMYNKNDSGKPHALCFISDVEYGSWHTDIC